ncbi:hypothetical protein DUNSADRAFT_11390 [Dunaliella salina]|uniref:Secreted protein n=1 Tax=Dunaliella salina TaxID=3046 RepID=A0ABQ7GDG3_DUNSA|nr:hypothetical protein DUNSADRAFT_11390 [Dunaliella salina]|eukprot:KAF5832645.1 hypothetical protein DUNSADRAFT_11390 [Dunaliella salina]
MRAHAALFAQICPWWQILHTRACSFKMCLLLSTRERWHASGMLMMDCGKLPHECRHVSVTCGAACHMAAHFSCWLLLSANVGHGRWFDCVPLHAGIRDVM